MRLAVPDMVSNSYFPAEAAIELGFLKAAGLDVSLELIFPVDRCYEALRSGEVDIVAGSAHSALAAFPRFEGVRLLCAQAQGMYWFLVMHVDHAGERGDLSALKGKRIGAAPWVNMGLRGLLAEGGLDPARDGIEIVSVPVPPEGGINFGLNAARALAERKIDGFWANGMGTEVAVRDGVGKVVLDVRRGDGPKAAFDFTMASIATREDFFQSRRGDAEAIVSAIAATQRALKGDAGRARAVGDRLFPASEAQLIVELIRRDLPYYDPAISARSFTGMCRFARQIGILDAEVRYEDAVATELAPLWAGA